MKHKINLTDLRRYNEMIVVAGIVLALGGTFSTLILNKTTWWSVALVVIGLAVLGVFLAANLKEVKATGKSRSTQVRTSLSLLALVVLVIVVAVNYIIQRHPVRFDLTASKMYSLAPQTLDALKNLKSDVTVTMFITQKRTGQLPEVARARELLDEYTKHSTKFHFKTVDADREPAVVKRYNIREYNVVVFESGENRRDVMQRDYVTYAFNGQKPTPKFQGEQAFTNALTRMNDTVQKVIYFTEGHGERDLANPQGIGLANLKGLLEGGNYLVKSIKLFQEKQMPADCTVLGILGPGKPFSSQETDMIRQWMGKGGKAILCVDPQTQTGLEPLLEDFGIKLGRNIVLDKTSFAPPDLANLIPTYDFHPIVEQMSNQKIFTVLPFCRSVEKVTPKHKGVTQVVFLKTTDQGWGETNLDTKKMPSYGPEDLKGPVPLAIACDWTPEGSDPSKPAAQVRFAVFGSSSFPTNAMMGAGGSMDMAVNAFNWAAMDEGKISIRPKEDENRMLNFTNVGAAFIKYLVVGFMPLGVLAVGAYLWYRRRVL